MLLARSRKAPVHFDGAGGGLCVDSGQARNKLGPMAAESTLRGVRVCVSARMSMRLWRPASAPGMALFYRAPKRSPSLPAAGRLLRSEADGRAHLPASLDQGRTQIIFCVRGVASPLLANIYLH